MTPLEAQQQLEALKKVAEQLQYTIPQDWLDKPLDNADKILDAFIKWDDELREITRDLGGLNAILKNNLQDLTKSNIQLLQSRKASRDLVSISQTLMNERRSIYDLDTKQLEKLKQQTKISNDLLSQSIRSGDLKGAELAAAQDNLRLGNELLQITEDRLELERQIVQKMGLAPAIIDGISKSLNKIGFGGLAEQLKLDDAISKTKEWIRENDGNVSSLSTLGKFSGNLLGNLTDMISPANLLQGAIVLLVKSLGSVDRMAGETAKQFGTSYEEANKLNQELTQIAAKTDNTFITTEALVQAQNSLNASLGTSNSLSGELLINYTELTKQAGYSIEAAITISKLSLTTGKTSKAITESYLGQVKALNLQNGLSINSKQLLNDISNISKGMLATFSQNPKELAKAAFEAKKVGLELKQIEGIQQSLLDIESSIGSEFEAEILTGKQLNLERARYYALTNDIASLAQELNKEGVTAQKFGEMNIIQQEAYAKALGMSRDELGNMLIEQEALSAVGAKDEKSLKEKYNLVKGTAKEQEFLNQLGNEEYAQQLKSTTVQERFLALTEKLQEVFIAMAGPVMDVVSPIMDLVATITAPIAWISEQFGEWGNMLSDLIGPLGQIGKLLKGVAMLAVGYAAYASYASLATIPVVGPVLGGVAAATILAAGTSFIGSIQDGQIGPDGGLMVSGPKGSIQLDKEDTFIGNKNGIIAGTNLGKKDAQIQNNDSGITVLASSLNNKMDQMINRLDSLIGAVNKGMVVNLDGNRVSQELATPMAINDRRI